VARLRAAGCVYAEEEAALLRSAAFSPGDLEGLLARRLAGVPLEHLVGWAEFCGLRVHVAAGVFVPRARTALLVDLAVRVVRDHRDGVPGVSGLEGHGLSRLVVDLCCGSGAVGAAIADRVPAAEVYAADLDPASVACARRNLPPDRVFEGDLYAALPDHLRGRVDVLVANAPYVPTDAIETMPSEARDHEPRAALDGGADGVDLHRRIAAGAPEWLAPGGHLLIETGRHQAALTVAACEDAGLRAHVVTDDDLEATAVVATRSVDSTE
jgi:release factor glutamine methyltransferase